MVFSHPLSLGTRLAEANGGPVFVVWCQLPGEGQAAAMVHAGFTGVVTDMQHGYASYDEMRLMMQAVGRAGGVPMMRPPLDDFGMAARALDAGASVIIAPMINTPDDARRLVDATKFPPLASRSFGPAQALELWGLNRQDYLSAANELTCVLAMIETAQAVSNMDEILAENGVDGIFVGPFDLSISLSGGKVGGAGDPDVVNILPRVVEAAQEHNKICGIYASGSEQARTFAALGFNLVSATSDAGLIGTGAKAVLDGI